MKTNINVRILENDFNLTCDIDEKETLIKSVNLIKKHLKNFRHKNPAIENEQLLIMGALHTACELVSKLEILSNQAKVANGEIQETLSLLTKEK